jgi:hypothetical protein
MRNPNRHGWWTIILILFLWSFSLAQDHPAIRELEQGKPIEREHPQSRIQAIAHEILANKPGMISLQEVALGRQGLSTRRLRLRRWPSTTCNCCSPN